MFVWFSDTSVSLSTKSEISALSENCNHNYDLPVEVNAIYKLETGHYCNSNMNMALKNCFCADCCCLALAKICGRMCDS